MDKVPCSFDPPQPHHQKNGVVVIDSIDLLELLSIWRTVVDNNDLIVSTCLHECEANVSPMNPAALYVGITMLTVGSAAAM
jgi:hypothetical protein